MKVNRMMDKNSAITVHPICCRSGPDAARQGHLACLQTLHTQGSFLGFHDKRRARAGDAEKAQTWLTALAACDGRQSEILAWLLAGGWPLAETERLCWHFRDMADPTAKLWYTKGRPCKAADIAFTGTPPVDVTAIDWDGQGEWCEMAQVAGLRDPRSEALRRHAFNGGLWGQSGVCQDWYPQEFQVLWRPCRSGDLACQRIIVEAGCRTRWVSVLAALTGQLGLLKFAIEQGCPWEGSTLVAAAAGGHVESLRYVLETCMDNVGKVPLQVQRDPRGPDCSPQWFFSKRFPLDYRETEWPKDLDASLDPWIVKAALSAAENGHVEVLKCIMTPKTQSIWSQPGLPYPASAALSHGRLPCLEFAREYSTPRKALHRCTQNPVAVQAALHAGHLHCVAYLLSHGLKMTPSFAFHAAKGGHLALLERVAARGQLRWDHIARGAVMGDQIACLRFAVEKGATRDAKLLLRSAKQGHDTCMRYLHENGYSAPVGTLSAAVASGSLQCVEFALDIRCPVGRLELRGLMVCAARRDLALVQCLHEREFPWEAGTTEAAARRGCLATLQYCHEHGCAWDPGVIEAAMLADSATCLRYIHTHDCPPQPWAPGRHLPAYNLEVLRYAVEHMGGFGEELLLATSAQLQAEKQHQYADWRLLLYMSQKGAALPRVLQRAAELRLARFDVMVSCFHLATRLAHQGGPHAPMWAVMGWIPHVLVERIAEMAHLRLRRRRAGEL